LASGGGFGFGWRDRRFGCRGGDTLERAFAGRRSGALTPAEFRADGYPVIRVSGPDYFARLHGRLRARLPVWVIYRPTTREYPGKWVARMHVVLPVLRPTRFVMTHDNLSELRALLPPDLGRAAADPADLPEIEETWF
jgi:hypothetical protein